MEQVIKICDKCGRAGATSFYPVVGFSQDGGGRNEEDTIRVDLCSDCIEVGLKKMLSKKNYGTNKEWASEMTTYKKQHEDFGR